MLNGRTCKQHGHRWRFEKSNGKHVRVCENCGLRLLLTSEDLVAWGRFEDEN